MGRSKERQPGSIASERAALANSSNGDSGERATIAGDGASPLTHGFDPFSQFPVQFGRYQILKRLGLGGMGAVFLADDTQLHRQVALKVPNLGLLEDSDAVERFYREARAAANISHANICPVYDVGKIDGIHYLTMAFIDGRPLAEFIRPGHWIPQRQVIAVIRKLALALDRAHRAGVIHRDLKPANIMISSDREPVIMDFGLARKIDSTSSRITHAGVVVGTPGYMAPEQITGELGPVGPAADIYSLGVILYEMLTGELPFNAPVAEIFYQILTVPPPPPSSHRPGLDPRLEAYCLKALAKRPDERFASMSDFSLALSQVMLDRSRAIRSTDSGPTVTGLADDARQHVETARIGDWTPTDAGAAMRKRREQLIEEARLRFEAGQLDLARKLLSSARALFPDDPQLDAFIQKCDKISNLIRHSVKVRIPELIEQRRIAELNCVVDELKSCGAAIKGLEKTEEIARRKLAQVEDQSAFAARSLERGDFDAALSAARKVLDVVADHAQCLRIAAQARRNLDLVHDQSPALSDAVNNHRWWRASRLLSEFEQEGIRDDRIQELKQQVDLGVARVSNFTILVVWTFLGGVLWFLAGVLAAIFHLGSDPLPNWRVADVNVFDPSVLQFTVPLAVQIVFAIIFLQVARCVILRRLALEGIVSMAAMSIVLLGLTSINPNIVTLAPPSVLPTLPTAMVEALQAGIRQAPWIAYGLAAAGVIASVSRSLIENTHYRASLLVPVTGVVATAVGLTVDQDANSYLRDLPAALVLCGLLSVCQLSHLRRRFLVVSAAALLSAGVGSGADRLEIQRLIQLEPLITAVLLSIAAILSLPKKELSHVSAAALLALLVSVVLAQARLVATVPPISVLLLVWFLTQGILGSRFRRDIEPQLPLGDWVDRWKLALPKLTSPA